MDISIIIVSYNTKEITRNCLKSIYDSTGKISFEVILVDNDSLDGSPAMVTKEFPQINIISNKDNKGFAKANNQGAKIANGKYLWLLNSDTVLQKNTLQELYTAAEKNSSYITSCQLLNQDGTPQPQGGALPTLFNTFTWMTNLDKISFVTTMIPPYQNDIPTEWVGGTSMFVRRDLYLGLRGLDENIFMYGEDVEFCARAAKGNIPIHFFKNMALTHLGQQSGSSERSILGEFTGLKYIFAKHHKKWEYNTLRVWLKLGALIRVIMYTFLGNVSLRKSYAKAFKLA
jgi:hypothetical protein